MLEAGSGWMAKHIKDMFKRNFLTGNKRYSLKFFQCRFFFLAKDNIFLSLFTAGELENRKECKRNKYLENQC